MSDTTTPIRHPLDPDLAEAERLGLIRTQWCEGAQDHLWWAASEPAPPPAARREAEGQGTMKA